MAGYQHLTVVGNLTADPELRYSTAGVAIGSFTVAVNRTWTDSGTGEKREKVTYFHVTAWRGLGELCNQYLRKGSQVMVTGEIETSAYLAQDGSARASLELNARDVVFLGSKRDEPQQEDGEHMPF